MSPEPTRVLLFSGHMVDSPTRPKPRLPPAHVDAAQRAIDALLDQLKAGPTDLAFSQGAAGGDLLFSQACLQRGVQLHWLLPLAEPAFVAASVLPSADGAAWLLRYQQTKARLAQPLLEMPQVLGPLPAGQDPFERCNQWLLDSALAPGLPLHFICLWDGGGADGPGGTRHMVEQVRQQAGQVHWIDTRTLHP
jgi:hypothetical protein